MLRRMERRFETDPEARLEQIMSAQLEDLDFQTDSVLVAQTIEEMFDGAGID